MIMELKFVFNTTYGYVMWFQEKQRTHQRIGHTCSGLKGSAFPNQIVAIIPHPMQGVFMETAFVILAQPVLHGRQIPLHHSRSLDVRDNVLGPWI